MIDSLSISSVIAPMGIPKELTDEVDIGSGTQLLNFTFPLSSNSNFSSNFIWYLINISEITVDVSA